MPPAHASHASMPGISQQHQPPKDIDYAEVIAQPLAPKKRVVDKQSFEYAWRSGVAGGLAGCAAKTVVAPLDRVKILFQSSNPQFAKYSGSWAGVAESLRVIHGQEGAQGLFRGHSATLMRVFPYAAIKFLAYEQIRSAIIPDHNHETPLRRLVSGSLAGITSVFFTYPLEVVRVRLAFETKREGRSSLIEICKKIYHEQPVAPKPLASNLAASTGGQAAAATQSVLEAAVPRSGLANFYRGFSPTMLGMLPYAGMSFLTHDTCGDILRRPLLAKWTTLPQPENATQGKPAPLRYWAELLSGGIAGLVSQSVSYPLEVIRRRMQVGGAVGDGRRLRIAETASLIVKEKGVRGFFVGLTIGYVKVVPMAAVAFYTYERFKLWFGI
ncbi:hypothetical protein PspLS_04729 [Pyricularia sp. CBS 133598]|nr:hypothetical protein PspLS_04729 [Pyricularia sp. CBS 133598]